MEDFHHRKCISSPTRVRIRAEKIPKGSQIEVTLLRIFQKQLNIAQDIN